MTHLLGRDASAAERRDTGSNGGPRRTQRRTERPRRGATAAATWAGAATRPRRGADLAATTTVPNRPAALGRTAHPGARTGRWTRCRDGSPARRALRRPAGGAASAGAAAVATAGTAGPDQAPPDEHDTPPLGSAAAAAAPGRVGGGEPRRSRTWRPAEPDADIANLDSWTRPIRLPTQPVRRTDHRGQPLQAGAPAHERGAGRRVVAGPVRRPDRDGTVDPAGGLVRGGVTGAARRHDGAGARRRRHLPGGPAGPRADGAAAAQPAGQPAGRRRPASHPTSPTRPRCRRLSTASTARGTAPAPTTPTPSVARNRDLGLLRLDCERPEVQDRGRGAQPSCRPTFWNSFRSR